MEEHGFLALGTHFGKVFLLDIQGNVTQKFDISPVKINQISLDDSGEHVGICSEDGKVQVFGLYTREGFHENFDCPIKIVALHPQFGRSSSKQFVTGGSKIVALHPQFGRSSSKQFVTGGSKIVALHPQFGRSSSKQFVTGGSKLQLYERNWLNRWKTLTLHEGEGTITNIKWKANLIAWANSVGVKIYDISTRQRITNVLRDNASLRPDMYPCSLCWKDSTTLVIGWGTSVKQDKEFRARPRLDIIQPLPEACEEISSDALTVRHFQENECRDYGLEHSEGESLFYIISPKDIVVAKERDQDDHIDWLLDKKKYEEALMAAEISFKNIKRHEVQGFATLIREWPGDLYNNMTVVQAVRDHLKKDPNNGTLLTTLAELYTYDQRYDRALKIYLQLRHKDVYQLIHKHNLFSSIEDKIALEICQQRNFVEETVFLLSRMGNSRRALQMIMEELHDVDKAIEFAKEQDDAELWEDLISYSIDKPPFITGLLNNIGTHVDPILLIHRIKEDMEIPSLRDSLVKILQDYNLQILLREGCKKILVADSLSLLKKMQRTQMRGVRVDEENICEACHAPILPTDTAKVFNVVVFHCRHMFHKECLPSPSTIPAVQFCNICSAKHRGPGSAVMEI
ncbi:UNVERIFIED_CONTAM: hypothetical protein FKN15_070771 [Acipenser sinensis]